MSRLCGISSLRGQGHFTYCKWHIHVKIFSLDRNLLKPMWNFWMGTKAKTITRAKAGTGRPPPLNSSPVSMNPSLLQVELLPFNYPKTTVKINTNKLASCQPFSNLTTWSTSFWRRWQWNKITQAPNNILQVLPVWFWFCFPSFKNVSNVIFKRLFFRSKETHYYRWLRFLSVKYRSSIL